MLIADCFSWIAGFMAFISSVFQLVSLCHVWRYPTRETSIYFVWHHTVSDVYFVHHIQQSRCLDSSVQVSWSDLGTFLLFYFCSVVQFLACYYWTGTCPIVAVLCPKIMHLFEAVNPFFDMSFKKKIEKKKCLSNLIVHGSSMWHTLFVMAQLVDLLL